MSIKGYSGLSNTRLTGKDLNTTLKTGTIPLSPLDARELSGGNFINASGNGGLLASDTTPALTFNSGGHRTSWVAGNTDTLYWHLRAPYDFDETKDLTIFIRASIGGTTDTPAITIDFREGMGNSNKGSSTSAYSGTSPVVKTVVIAGGNLAGDAQWNVKLTPGSHGTDTVRVDEVWIEYTRK